MTSLARLQEKLKKLEIDIQEAERRLPAHSVKPAMMAELLELEDEREAIMAQIRTLQNSE